MIDINKTMSQIDEQIVKDIVDDVTQLIFDESQKLVPVDSGRLKASGKIIKEKDREIIRYTAPYAYYVHEDANGRGFKFLERAIFKVRNNV